MPDKQVAYPEHEKLSQISDVSNAIGQFLDWLNSERRLTICQNGVMDERPVYWLDIFREDFKGDKKAMMAAARKAGVLTDDDTSWYHDAEPKLAKAVHHYEEFEREGYYPAGVRITDLLAEYFHIDQNQLDREKRDMLEEFRKKTYGEEPLGV